MNRFQKFTNRIVAEDKVLYFETCCLIMMVVSLLSMSVLGIVVSAVSSCLFAVVAGLLKESYGYNAYVLFDHKDIVSDVLASFTGLLIIILIG